MAWVNRATIELLTWLFSQLLIQFLYSLAGAMRTGDATAQFFQDIDSKIINSVDYVVNYRQEDLKKASPSQIIKLMNNGQITIIRK